MFFSSQYGFRSKHSTELAVLEVIDRVILQLDKKEVPINIFLDLSKAFDTLNHDILLRKLEYYGIKGIANNVFRNYLTNRQQYVSWNDTVSENKLITTGVPQGSVLGPLLFIIYINDFSKVSKLFKFINYADDSTLCSTLNAFGIRKSDNINKELDKVTEWLKINKLSLNIDKTQYMLFHHFNKNVTVPNIRIENVDIKRVDDFNLLRVVLDKHLNWKSHTDRISNKVS